jgi:hypothetical protein
LNGSTLPRLLDSLASFISHGKSGEPTPAFGAYRFLTDDREEIRICIDSMDYPMISEDAAAACDLYFKTNYWASYNYPSKVLPSPNMNPLVGRNLDLFRGLRTAPKVCDVFSFFRVWGGGDEVEGIEHNMALLEGIHKTQCNIFLLAYLVAGDITSQGKRLDSIGVPWTTKPMPAKTLWQRAAGARLNIVRLGMHECIPWRMIDILAMGGVPVFDYAPRSIWPEPLVEGKHYLNLDFCPGRGDAKKIPEKIGAWLKDESLILSISHNTAEYFDRYLSPEKLGTWVMQSVKEWQEAQSRLPSE